MLYTTQRKVSIEINWHQLCKNVHKTSVLELSDFLEGKFASGMVIMNKINDTIMRGMNEGSQGNDDDDDVVNIL